MSSTKKQKFEYSGKLEEYQLYKKNTYTKYEDRSIFSISKFSL